MSGCTSKSAEGTLPARCARRRRRCRADLPAYALGNFGTVQELREFLAGGRVQLATSMTNRVLAAAFKELFNSDPDVPLPGPDGALYLPVRARHAALAAAA